MSNSRAPCAKCGTILHTGEGRITMSFSLAELEDLVFSTANPAVVRRFICAIGILDREREKAITTELAAIPTPPQCLSPGCEQIPSSSFGYCLRCLTEACMTP